MQEKKVDWKKSREKNSLSKTDNLFKHQFLTALQKQF